MAERASASSPELSISSSMIAFHSKARVYLGEMIRDAEFGAKGRELAHRFRVSAPCIAMADVRAEEVAQPLAGLGPRREDGG